MGKRGWAMIKEMHENIGLSHIFKMWEGNNKRNASQWLCTIILPYLSQQLSRGSNSDILNNFTSIWFLGRKTTKSNMASRPCFSFFLSQHEKIGILVLKGRQRGYVKKSKSILGLWGLILTTFKRQAACHNAWDIWYIYKPQY